jgi:hypothetical protein
LLGGGASPVTERRLAARLTQMTAAYSSCLWLGLELHARHSALDEGVMPDQRAGSLPPRTICNQQKTGIRNAVEAIHEALHRQLAAADEFAGDGEPRTLRCRLPAGLCLPAALQQGSAKIVEGRSAAAGVGSAQYSLLRPAIGQKEAANLYNRVVALAQSGKLTPR